MAITYSKFFQPTLLALTLTTLYTVPTTPSSSLLRGARIRLTNTSGSAVSVQVNAVPNGGSASSGNQVVPTNYTVPANNWVDVDIPIMQAGDFLQALAGTANVIVAHPMSGGLFS